MSWKTSLSFWRLLSLCMVMLVSVAGCANSGGTAGDENDPAAVSDEEQMQDETGDV